MASKLFVPRYVWVIAIILLPLIVAESVAHWIWSHEDVVFNPANAIYKDDAVLSWRLRSSLETTRFGKRFRTNELGLRNGPVALPKPKTVFRILSLGESTTMGEHVAQDETYSALLEQRLNQAFTGKGITFEVINAGVGGYTLWQSYVYFEDRGQDLQPDMVLLYHQSNDFLPTGVFDRNNFLYDVATTDKVLYEGRRKYGFLMRLLLSSRLYQGARKLMVSGPGALSPLSELSQSQGVGPRVPEHDRQLALHRLRALCRVLSVTPVILQPCYRDLFRGDSLLQQFSVDNDVPYIDLPYARYTTPWPESPPIFVDAIHPSAAGHKLVAETIFKRLWTLKLLPGME